MIDNFSSHAPHLQPDPRPVSLMSGLIAISLGLLAGMALIAALVLAWWLS